MKQCTQYGQNYLSQLLYPTHERLYTYIQRVRGLPGHQWLLSFASNNHSQSCAPTQYSPRPPKMKTLVRFPRVNSEFESNNIPLTGPDCTVAWTGLDWRGPAGLAGGCHESMHGAQISLLTMCFICLLCALTHPSATPRYATPRPL